jgi:hypothetical protein
MPSKNFSTRDYLGDQSVDERIIKMVQDDMRLRTGFEWFKIW